MQPGGECRFATECVDLAKHLHERLLGQVLGLGRISDHAQAHGIHASLVLTEEGLECALFSLFGRVSPVRRCLERPVLSDFLDSRTSPPFLGKPSPTNAARKRRAQVDTTAAQLPSGSVNSPDN